MKWLRVTRANKCTVCGKSDWCTYSPELNLACCMRIDSPRLAKNGGFFHSLGGTPVRPVLPDKHQAPPSINATKIIRDWRIYTSADQIRSLAKELGVNPDALEALGTAWAPQHNAWAFPMKDGYGNVVGIRLRNRNGFKWAVPGSKAGLIYSQIIPGDACLCEGPTDTAAALTLGLNVIGRPSCRGSEDDILTALKPCRRLLIIADNDDPGWNGAVHLQTRLKIPSVCWAPPTKDLREFLRAGGTPALLRSLTSSLIWTNPPKTHDRNPQSSLQNQHGHI